MSLRFHWMLPKGGEVRPGAAQTPQEAARYRVDSTQYGSAAPRPDFDGWMHFAEHAEAAGIDSVLISFSRYEPDPLVVSCALGQATKKLRFMLAYRSGLMQPATFVQQINTLSTLIDGRVSLNIVAGSSSSEQRGYGDFLAHDERYERADEFLAVCHRFWRDGEVDFDGSHYRVAQGKLHTPFQGGLSPEIYISGHSEQSERLAATHGSCWLRVADTPQKLRDAVARMRAKGLGVCLRACLICRPTREEAVAVGQSLIPSGDVGGQGETVRLKDSSVMHAAARAGGEHWLSPSLWTGLVPYYGPVWTTLLGTPDQLADTLLDYARIGVTEFILSGWPEVDTIDCFGSEVLPRVRRQEVH